MRPQLNSCRVRFPLPSIELHGREPFSGGENSKVFSMCVCRSECYQHHVAGARKEAAATQGLDRGNGGRWNYVCVKGFCSTSRQPHRWPFDSQVRSAVITRALLLFSLSPCRLEWAQLERVALLWLSVQVIRIKGGFCFVGLVTAFQCSLDLSSCSCQPLVSICRDLYICCV